jgi:hypothetical protein
MHCLYSQRWPISERYHCSILIILGKDGRNITGYTKQKLIISFSDWQMERILMSMITQRTRRYDQTAFWTLNEPLVLWFTTIECSWLLFYVHSSLCIVIDVICYALLLNVATAAFCQRLAQILGFSHLQLQVETWQVDMTECLTQEQVDQASVKPFSDVSSFQLLLRYYVF